ncbi:MAG: hypothetical protein L6V87_04685 [Ruminococcus sp.]|nr:MAG: hypothetical protein L6V87_04685 [Ruminococcus sp.]
MVKMYVDNGKAVTGMEEIDGETYYFNSKGIMKNRLAEKQSQSRNITSAVTEL